MSHKFLQRMTPPKHRLRLAAHSMPTLTRDLPPAASELANLNPVRDQGPEGCCTGFGVSRFTEHFNKLPPYLSPAFNYAHARMAEGTFPADDGAIIGDSMASAEVNGICIEKDLPYEANPAEAPTDADNQEALSNRIGQPLQVDFSDDGTSLKTNIACGKLVVIGFVVPGNFESGVGSNGIMPTPDESPSPGGHCVVVYGYHTDADGTLWLDIRNSWSAGWGDAGDFHAKFTDLAPKVSEAWTC